MVHYYFVDLKSEHLNMDSFKKLLEFEFPMIGHELNDQFCLVFRLKNQNVDND